MAEHIPVGREETQIGNIEELMATPERRIKRRGETAVVVRSSGQIESDWIIEKFDPETGAAIVSKRDEKGKLLRKEISREEFLATNFPRSEEMVGAIDREKKRFLGMAVFNEKTRKRQEKDIEVMQDIKDAFAAGDIGPMRDYFVRQMKEMEKRFSQEDNLQHDEMRELTVETEDANKELVDLNKRFIFARSAEEKRRISDAMISVRNRLGPALKKREDIQQKLRLGHHELNEVMQFVSILDQEIERKEKKAA